MKKTLLLTTCVMISTSVWAFGGVGIFGHKSHHSSGVNSIGVHIDANGDNTTPDITLADCNGNGVKGVDNNCYCNQGYTGTYCETKLCETGSYCGMDGDNPLCCPSDHICTTAGDVLGTCWRAESGCTTNADCETAEGCAGGNCYCKLGVTGYCNYGQEVFDETPVGGTCEPKGDGTPSNEVKDANNNVIFAAGQFLVGGEYMNWWSASNWCKAQGKELLRLSHIKIAQQTNWDGWCDLPCECDEICEEDDCDVSCITAICDYPFDYDGTEEGAQNVCKPLGSTTIMNVNDEYYGNLLLYIRRAIGNEGWYWLGGDWNVCLSAHIDIPGGVIGNGGYSRDNPSTFPLCE